MKKGKDSFYAKYIKRVLDIICALLAMIVFCWLYAIIAVLVRIKLGSPVIFKQDRPGKDENIFTLYKFRTMTDEKDEEGKLLSDDERLTKFGRLLRSTSLDELPEVWNILRGNMSVVGPRPLAVVYLPYYQAEEHHRHDVRPGLTGLAQVNGRNTITWEERFENDIKYIKSMTLFFDIKIIKKTIDKVLKREDIIQGNEGLNSLHIEREKDQ